MKRIIRNSRLHLIVGLLVFMLWTEGNANGNPVEASLIRNGDRVVFWGDSITDASFHFESIESYFRNRYPDYDIDFFNLAWSGERADNWGRLERDLLPLKPTLVFMHLGMNDGQYNAFEQAECDRYIQGIKKLVRIIQDKTAARIVLITPISYEANVRSDAKGQYLSRVYVDTLRRFSESLISLAKAHDYPVIDLNAAYLQVISDYKQTYPTRTFSKDGIHPTPSGHALITFLLLEALKADGNIMNLHINMDTGSVITAEHQEITGLTKTGDTVSFIRKPLAFPFNVKAESSLEIDIRSWYHIFNRNIMRVSGLKKPYGLLSVNGRDMGIYTKAALEQGVNLARIGMPEDEVTEFVATLINEKYEARYKRWREILTKGMRRDDASPYYPENYESKYLYQKGEQIAGYFHSGAIALEGYHVTLRETDAENMFPDAPFTLIPPYPLPDEVQVLFIVNTTPWKNVISEKHPEQLNFEYPLKIKVGFSGWHLVEMYDNGTHGDQAAGDGKWSIALNLKKAETPIAIAFDDNSAVRSANASLFMEIITSGLDHVSVTRLIPDKHNVMEITAEHFQTAVQEGYIRIRQ